MLRKYKKAMSNTLQGISEYRLNFVLSFVYNLIPLTAYVFLWIAVYTGDTDGKIKGYTLSSMITYYIIATWVEGLTGPALWDEVSDNIRTGALSNYLLKPVSYMGYYFYSMLAANLPYSGIGIVVISIFTIFVRDYFIYPLNVYTILLFLLSVVLGYILGFLIGFLRSLMAFWFEEISGVDSILGFMLSFLSGSFVPLDILPKRVFEWLELLPFQYLVYFPINVYLQKVSLWSAARGIMIQLCWIALFYVIIKITWARGLRKYSAVGG